jgi:hypothetical protein
MLKNPVILFFLKTPKRNALFIGVTEARFSFSTNFFVHLQGFQIPKKTKKDFFHF